MMYRVHERSADKYTVQMYDRTTHREWIDVVDEIFDYNTAYICMNNLARVISRFSTQPIVAIAKISARAFVDGKEVETV